MQENIYKESEMKKAIVLAILVAMLAGCASVEIEKTLTDGTKLKGRYVRLFNQSIDGFTLSVDPNGVWRASFDKQKSDVEVALEYAGARLSAGGVK